MLPQDSPIALQDVAQHNGERPDLAWKLWLYTNFDCNLRCSYCVAESTPSAPRRELGLYNVQRLVDEAVELGFEKVLLTGGEPLMLPDIYDMIAYSSARLKTTLLTNAMLLRGHRLRKLCEANHENLSIQVSLDGGSAEPHDAYRGAGTWAKTVDGIAHLQTNGFRVLISTTETPANTSHLEKLHAFRRSLGIPDEDHFVRPLARRGFSDQGLEVGTDTLIPELTVTIDGVDRHPLVSPSDTDMLVRREIFPLATAVECLQQRLNDGASVGESDREEFT